MPGILQYRMPVYCSPSIAGVPLFPAGLAAYITEECLHKFGSDIALVYGGLWLTLLVLAHEHLQNTYTYIIRNLRYLSLINSHYV